MQFPKLSLLFALAAAVAAQDVDTNDLPQQCRDICANIVQWSQSCDNNNTDEQATQCICGSTNANSIVPACDACVRNFNNGNGGDVHDILTSCSFTTTSYNAAAASTLASTASGATSGAAPASASASSASASASASASMSASAAGSAAQSSVAQQSTNAAPAHTAAAAVAGIGAFGLALAVL